MIDFGPTAKLRSVADIRAASVSPEQAALRAKQRAYQAARRAAKPRTGQGRPTDEHNRGAA